MSIVGITEDMKGTFLLLDNLVGGLPQKALGENVSHENFITIDEISKKTLNKIREKLEYDFIIYERGKSIFKEKLSEMAEPQKLRSYLFINPENNHSKVLEILKSNESNREVNDRLNGLKELITDKNSRILELGPLNRPSITKKEFPNCFYCDIRSTQQVKDLYTSNDYLPDY